MRPVTPPSLITRLVAAALALALTIGCGAPERDDVVTGQADGTPPSSSDADAGEPPEQGDTQGHEPLDDSDTTGGPAAGADTDDHPDDLGPATEQDTAPSGPCPSYGPPQAVGTVPPSITEASGLVVSQAHPGVLWVHNDSGDKANIYALEAGGERLATVTLEGTYAYDWEDMAQGPCEDSEDSENCLYVGDIGDNSRVRTYLKIHRLVEPDVALGDQTLTLDDYDTMTVIYPDEPHDCEGLIVDDHGHVYLLTKEWNDTSFRLYGTPFLPGVTLVPLQFMSAHDISDLGGTVPLVTAATFSRTLNRLLVRTYGGAFEYQLPPGGSLSDLPWAAVRLVPVANEGQGEAIAYDSEGYWHVSEGKEPPIWRILCQ